jgi:hypothetical protein
MWVFTSTPAQLLHQPAYPLPYQEYREIKWGAWKTAKHVDHGMSFLLPQQSTHNALRDSLLNTH